MVKTLLSALSLYNFKRKQDNVEIETNSYHQPLFDTSQLVLFKLTNSS